VATPCHSLFAGQVHLHGTGDQQEFRSRLNAARGHTQSGTLWVKGLGWRSFASSARSAVACPWGTVTSKVALSTVQLEAAGRYAGIRGFGPRLSVAGDPLEDVRVDLRRSALASLACFTPVCTSIPPSANFRTVVPHGPASEETSRSSSCRITRMAVKDGRQSMSVCPLLQSSARSRRRARQDGFPEVRGPSIRGLTVAVVSSLLLIQRRFGRPEVI
jgi:hypothetical protein